jgi:hypothetical protein
LRGLPDFPNFLEYCRKKDLTNPARAGIMARGPIYFVSSLYYWRTAYKNNHYRTTTGAGLDKLKEIYTNAGKKT